MADYCSYSHWSSLVRDDLYDNDGKVTCTQCDGSGESECECCSSWVDCEYCQGKGILLFSDLSGRGQKNYKPPYREYFKAAIADIHKLCDWSNKDFLIEVTPIVKLYRGIN